MIQRGRGGGGGRAGGGEKRGADEMRQEGTQDRDLGARFNENQKGGLHSGLAQISIISSMEGGREARDGIM